ncbi:MAG: phosphoribosyltransferase [Chromatiaceae bacterium]|nr:phosphoribosyltransferase [Chromatiaceae bacterium]
MKTALDQPIQPIALRAPWVSAFPDVDIHAPESSVKKHPRYQAAKGGDTLASVDLVLEMVDKTAIDRLRAYQDLAPVIVPVHGLEGISSNTIPAALAVCLADMLGFNLSAEIVQTSRAAHTGSSGWWRLKSHALFSGEVAQGVAYILVDDFVGMGGTFASLRGLIEAKGGRVIHAQALTGKPRSATLALQPVTL